jgi:hypothetical protein
LIKHWAPLQRVQSSVLEHSLDSPVFEVELALVLLVELHFFVEIHSAFPLVLELAR